MPFLPIELHITIHPMIKVLVDLLILVLNDSSDKLCRVAPVHQMVLLFVLAYNLAAHFTLGGIAVALHCVGCKLFEKHFSRAIGALNYIVAVLICAFLLYLARFGDVIIIVT